MLDGNEVESGNAGEIGTEAGIFAATEIEEASDTGLAEIGVDQQGLVAKLRECDSEICRGGGLALARQRAGNQNDLRRMLGLGKKERGAQGAESFRHLRFGQMLSNKLDVLLVPVATQAGNKFAPPIFGVVVVSESRNDSQRRQAGEGFDVVRSLH